MVKFSMAEKWYNGEKSEADRLYEESIGKIREAVGKGMSFDDASGLIDVKDGALKAQILDDSLKVIISDMHFSGKKSLEELSGRLKVPLKKLKEAKEEMLKDVEAAAIEKYKSELKKSGNA
jgi:hypothetical protein